MQENSIIDPTAKLGTIASASPVDGSTAASMGSGQAER
jgi:hypothetical protein